MELKLWRGDAAHELAYEQLLGYMESKNAKEGFLLTSDFRKQKPVCKSQVGWKSAAGRFLT